MKRDFKTCTFTCFYLSFVTKNNTLAAISHVDVLGIMRFVYTGISTIKVFKSTFLYAVINRIKVFFFFCKLFLR